MKLRSQKGCDIVRIDGVNGGVNDRAVDVFHIIGILKHDVDRIFDLHDAPAVHQPQFLGCWAVPIRQNVARLMEILDPDVIRQPLRYKNEVPWQSIVPE